MQNLYKTAALNKEKTTPNKPPAPAPVIDLTENTIIETNPKPCKFFIEFYWKVKSLSYQDPPTGQSYKFTLMHAFCLNLA